MVRYNPLHSRGHWLAWCGDGPGIIVWKRLKVAQTLQELGIMPGDRMGVVGYACNSDWARLARLKIAAEVLEGNAAVLWRGDKSLGQSVLQSFSGPDAKVVIAEYVPECVRMTNWHRVDSTNFLVYAFAEP